MTLKLTSSAFVIMPFREPFMTLFSAAISPALEEQGLTPQLAPNIEESRDVMSNIYRGLWQSRLVVADLTGLNFNVLYELGVAFTLNKQVILVSQNVESLPFDLRRDKVLVYTDTLKGRAGLRAALSKEIQSIMTRGWSAVPSWKEGLNADILPVPALLEIESKISHEAWIIEPEESFQDTVFYEVILTNLERGVEYKFIVTDQPDVESAFRGALEHFYGMRAQVLYVPETRLQIPVSFAIFDPTSPSEKGYQYLPNGHTVYGIPMSRGLLRRARRLFMAMWQNRDFRKSEK